VNIHTNCQLKGRNKNMEQQIKILIIEDDSYLASKLTEILNCEADFAVVGVGTNKRAAVRLAELQQPDVIILALKLTDSINDGIEATKEIAKKTRAMIIALTDFDNQELIERAWEVGVKDYINKNQLYWLSDKIRDVYYGHAPTLVLLDKVNRLEKEARYNRLTPSEKEILVLLNAGFSINEIVKKLCKTEKTVHNQKSSFIKKLGVTSYKEAMELYKDFIG
jgi:DNA-binding NarL/FixJ family response regulator